jgi:hypothetical protein
MCSEIMLYRTRILLVIRKPVPARVPQHVWMHRERKLRGLPCPSNLLPKASGHHGSQALGIYLDSGCSRLRPVRA